MKNFWFQAHWLVGISAGIVLAIVGATGGILSFEDEIQAWLNRDVRQVAPAGAALEPGALRTRIEQQQPGVAITALQFSGDPAAAVRVSMGRDNTRYANPYTGELIAGDGSRGREFFRTTRTLHRYLVAGSFGHREVGKHLVGASTLLCVALGLSGLYLRWPRRRQLGSLRNWLTFDPAMKGRPFLWHLHAIIGTWVLALLLVMALTGPYWSYEWYRSGMFAVAGVEQPPRRNEAAPRNGNAERGGERREHPRDAAPPVTANLDAAWGSFHAQLDGAGLRTATMNLPQEGRDTLEIRYVLDGAHSRANNTLTLDAVSGAVRKHERHAEKTAGGRFMSSVLAWHSGSVFGIPGKALFMLAALAMPLFTITGWMMYLQRRNREKLQRRR